MELEKQVTSLELSKKLKELGIWKDSLYYWVMRSDDFINEKWEIENYPKGYAVRLAVPAYTVAELGEMLAKAFRELKGTIIMNPRGDLRRKWQKVTGFDNESDNRAKLLIYLIKNKLITL